MTIKLTCTRLQKVKEEKDRKIATNRAATKGVEQSHSSNAFHKLLFFSRSLSSHPNSHHTLERENRKKKRASQPAAVGQWFFGDNKSNLRNVFFFFFVFEANRKQTETRNEQNRKLLIFPSSRSVCAVKFEAKMSFEWRERGEKPAAAEEISFVDSSASL